MDDVWFFDRDEKINVMNLICHRRAGKSRGASGKCNDDIKTIMSETEIFNFQGDMDSAYPKIGYIAPTKTQARDIIWNYLKDDLREFPGVEFNNTRLTATIPRPWLSDELQVSLLASKYHDRIRGGKFRVIFNDEAQDAPEDALETSIKAALEDCNGKLYNFGTPKGDDHFYKFVLHYYNLGAPVFKFPIDKSFVFDKKKIATMIKEYPPDVWDREFLCKFLAPIKGAFYYDILKRLKKEPWFYNAEYFPNESTYLFVDIGVNKAFSVWVAQVPHDQGEVITLLDFYEDYTNLLDLKNDLDDDGYFPDVIILPHDARNNVLHLTHSVKVYDLFREMFKYSYIPAPIERSKNLMADIDMVSRNLHMCRLPAIEMASDTHRGIRYLGEYSRKKDSATGNYTGKIDKSRGVDHCADALRNGMVALGVRDGRIRRRYKFKATGGPSQYRNRSILNSGVFVSNRSIFDMDTGGGYTNTLRGEGGDHELYERPGKRIEAEQKERDRTLPSTYRQPRACT